jgi:hypothetical protein
MVLVQIPVQACLDKVLWIGLMWTMILIANNVYYSLVLIIRMRSLCCLLDWILEFSHRRFGLLVSVWLCPYNDVGNRLHHVDVRSRFDVAG